MERETAFLLPAEVEHHLSTLGSVYKKAGETTKLKIVVNAQVRVQEGWICESWSEGDSYGHAVHLMIPEQIFSESFPYRDRLQKAIRDDLNRLNHERSEHYAEVILEMQRIGDRDWRRESGVLVSGRQQIAPDEAARIWGDRGFRVFLSHKTEVKKETAKLKSQLSVFGATSFVAHEDIHPTKEWQNEIEKALMSMDAFVALLTDKFHDSLWTDQEVGFAVARGVPIIAVRLGKDPYGFIGKFQALTCTWEDAPEAIALLLINEPKMLDAYIAALPTCGSYEEGNVMAKVLPAIQRITASQADSMVAIYNADSQLRGSYGFNGRMRRTFGDGLAFHLTRCTAEQYFMNEFGLIEKASEAGKGTR